MGAENRLVLAGWSVLWMIMPVDDRELRRTPLCRWLGRDQGYLLPLSAVLIWASFADSALWFAFPAALCTLWTIAPWFDKVTIKEDFIEERILRTTRYKRPDFSHAKVQDDTPWINGIHVRGIFLYGEKGGYRIMRLAKLLTEERANEWCDAINAWLSDTPSSNDI